MELEDLNCSRRVKACDLSSCDCAQCGLEEIAIAETIRTYWFSSMIKGGALRVVEVM